MYKVSRGREIVYQLIRCVDNNKVVLEIERVLYQNNNSDCIKNTVRKEKK